MRYLTCALIVMTAGACCPTTLLSTASVPPTGKIRWEKRWLWNDLNEGIDVADVNRDGKLDVIAGTRWFEAPNFKPHPLRDIGVDNEEFFASNGDHAIDLNGDGWVDIISASWFAHQIYWYENPGKEGLAAGSKWRQRLVVQDQHACEGILLEDLDEDGTPEIVVNTWSEERPLVVVRIKLGRDGALPEFRAVELGRPSTGHGTAVGDINGDERKDILVPHGWFEAPAGDRFARKWKFHNVFHFHHISVPCVVTDVNADGKNDIIVGQGHDYGLRWFEQGPAQDGEITWTEHEIDKRIAQLHCLYWADLDGDGARELVTGKRWRPHKGHDPGADEPVCLVRYLWDLATRAFERDVISYDQGVGTGMQMRLVDLDGDGRLDIAVAGKTGTYILFNRGPAREK